MSTDVLNLIGRRRTLFANDLVENQKTIVDLIHGSKVLIVGAAGSIGQAVCKEVFNLDPKALCVVDISENNLVELVREIRSTIGYGTGEFKAFAIDIGSVEFEAMVNAEGPFDYVFNLSALKHVRSEKDAYSLMRMVNVNIYNTLKVLKLTKHEALKNYFCVSTDKAANPVNMMGASKRIMEMFLMRESLTQNVTMARFANVAFSDGSLLHGFNQRFLKRQPISAPLDVRRYFVTPQESGQLCLLSGMLGQNRDIFFPKLREDLHLTTFSDIAIRYLQDKGYEPYYCRTEDEARKSGSKLISERKWPCYFFESDTTGEKEFEEFYTLGENIDMNSFDSIGVVKSELSYDDDKLEMFDLGINTLLEKGTWGKEDILLLFLNILESFNHKETGKYLDQRM